MSENSGLNSQDVVLGFDAAWGFAPADQTSPALAGAAGALIDTTMTDPLADLHHNIDQPCWDPAILVPDVNPSPPPTHRHSQWWQDPRTNEVGDHLVRLLGDRLYGWP